jgi:hypothetical protein
MTDRYQDPADPLNGPKYHTGKLCVEGCGRPAGTHWSHLWCQPCNAARMDRIGKALRTEIERLEGRNNDQP